MQGQRPSLSYLKSSKKYLQPPTLHNSGLLSSGDRTEYRVQQLHELSNVEQKSYASSQQLGQEEKEIREVLAGIKSRKMDQQEPSSPISIKSRSLDRRSSLAPKLEDQAIIAVDEQVDMEQEKGNQSIILEHIDFNSEPAERQLEKKKAQPVIQESLKGNGEKYYIHCVEPVTYLEHQHNGSDSGLNDLSSFELKPNRARLSKNTCIQRIHSIGPESNRIRISNQSCMSKPMGGSDERDSINSPQSQEDIDKILKKWNTKDYNTGLARLPAVRKHQRGQQNQNDVDLEMNAKYCVSQFKEQSIEKEETSRFLRMSTGREGKKERVLADEENEDNIRKYKEMTERLSGLQQRCKQAEQEKLRLESVVEKDEYEIFQLQKELQNQKVEVLVWKERCKRSDDSQAKKGEEIRRLETRLYQLERVIQKQNESIKFYEEKNEKLEKELEKTIRYNDTAQLACNSPLKKSLKMSKFDTFGQMTPDTPDHHLCIEKIQALEEHIFDIEQKIIGIDIEVDKRVKIIGEHIDINLRRTIHQEYQSTLAALNEEISRLLELNKTLERQKTTRFQDFRLKQKDLQLREAKVKKMYDELVKQWREVQKERNKYKETNHSDSALKHYHNQMSNYNSEYRNDEHERHRKRLTYTSRQLSPKKERLKYPEREAEAFEHVYSIQNLGYKRHIASPSSRRAHTIGNDEEESIANYTNYSFAKRNRRQELQFPRQVGKGEELQLLSLNSKIQKLREQINRQLDLIH